ncbi:MAG: hypothetical protein GEU83_06330 [Pseudonocardiaceae bacterium]|nr:hypothetical protein [Pseudonocardiaceae bacterium]
MTMSWLRRSTASQQRRPATDQSHPSERPYAMTPPASADEARQRVQELVEGLLPDGVDEGTGTALDKLITSWAAGWLAGIDTQHADRTAAIDGLISAANEQITDARAAHEHQALRLEIARQEQLDTRQRLGGTPPRSLRPPDIAATDPTWERR